MANGDSVESGRFIAEPIPTEWGEQNNGLKCRIIKGEVTRAEQSMGHLWIKLQVEIMNVTKGEKRLIIEYDEKSHVVIIPGCQIQMKRLNKDGNEQEEWVSIASTLDTGNIPKGEIRIAAGECRSIGFGAGIKDRFIKSVLTDGQSLKAYIHGTSGSNLWTGVMCSGVFSLKRQ
jgi:hypothetical protein